MIITKNSEINTHIVAYLQVGYNDKTLTRTVKKSMYAQIIIVNACKIVVQQYLNTSKYCKTHLRTTCETI